MKITMLFLWVIILFPQSKITLEDIRSNYELAVADEEICRAMIQHLGHHRGDEVQLAYLGGFQTMWANHVSNPITKLNSFNKGKNHIDSAAKLAPDNLEVIFIRYSVQKNSPGFLGYKHHLAEDRIFLTENLSKIPSPTLRRMVENVLGFSESESPRKK